MSLRQEFLALAQQPGSNFSQLCRGSARLLRIAAPL